MKALSRAVTKWGYYVVSVVSLLRSARAPLRVIKAFSGLTREGFRFELKSGELFMVRSPMDLRGGEPAFHTTAEVPPSLREGDSPDSAIMVQTITLDELIADAGFERVDFLKMDCEGAEFEIFFSAESSTLSKVARICLEYHDGWTEHHHLELIEHFAHEGFEVELYPNPVRSDIGLMHAFRRE